MGFGIVLTSLGISIFDIICLKKIDINTCRKIKQILESYDYKIISSKNIRKEIWNELFKTNKKIKDIQYDDIELFYRLSILPGTNVFSLYQNIIKENSEIRNTYNLCVDMCLNDSIIKKLKEDKFIVEDDWLEKEDIKILNYRKKDKSEKNINK